MKKSILFFFSLLLVLCIATEYNLSFIDPFFHISSSRSSNSSEKLALLMSHTQNSEQNSSIIINVLNKIPIDEIIPIYSNMIWRGTKTAILFGTYGEIQVNNSCLFYLENFIFKKNQNSSDSVRQWFFIQNPIEFLIKV